MTPEQRAAVERLEARVQAVVMHLGGAGDLLTVPVRVGDIRALLALLDAPPPYEPAVLLPDGALWRKPGGSEGSR